MPEDSERMVYNAIKTPDGTILVSRHRHDYKTHKDAVSGEVYMVDGGLDYVRRSVNEQPAENLNLSLADLERAREVVTWGARGPKGDQPLTYITVAEMSTDHLLAVLFGNTTHRNLSLLMEKELAFRSTTS